MSEQVTSTVAESVADEQMAMAAGKKPTAMHKRYSVTSIMDDDFDFEMMDPVMLTSMFEKTLSTISENEIITGRIVAINNSEVAIDIGFKSEGLVPLSEFTNRDELKIGDEVEVFLENIEDSDGKMVLSRRRADFMRVWERINKAFETQDIVQAKILRRIKGGMVVDLMGIDAFLPGSQIDVKPVRDFDAWINRTLDVRVVKINHPNENVVVSHKVLLEEQIAGVRQEVLERLKKVSFWKVMLKQSLISACLLTLAVWTVLFTLPTFRGDVLRILPKSCSWMKKLKLLCLTLIPKNAAFRLV
jgi:DNA-directed RNA polymerase subunit E'/Rpb7